MFQTLRGLRSRRVGMAVAWLSLLFSGAVSATSADGVWDDVAERSITSSPAARQIVPQRYRTVRLDTTRFESLLRGVPKEAQVALDDSDATLELPLVDGGYATFLIAESPVLEPALAKKYPDLRTWIGQGIDDPTATLRFDVTPKGFHAQILSAGGTHYIDPYQRGDVVNYIAYRKEDHAHGETIRCGVTGEELGKEAIAEHLRHVGAKVSSGATLRTYRLAMAATGEYTQFHGGTVADGLAGIVSTVNRVNGIYEREVSVRFVLVGNNDEIVYTDAGSDPYANSSGDLAANISNINMEIGSANYDVGHLVGTGGGGVAGLGVICTANKARGLTGSGSPVGDGFDVDYVAHEMGHQFGGSHTFNGSGLNCSGGNRSAGQAYETGSGITIQAYAGICAGDNLQPNSEDYFHRVSLNQILTHTTSGSGGTCGTTNATGNAIPTVTPAGAAFTIPASTPFELDAGSADGDGDTLTYVWEQFDLGAANAEGVMNPAVTGPMFRSFAPTTASTRVFPSLRYILDNANVPPASAPLPGTTTPNWFTGEVLPSTARTMNFRVTVRDNRAAGGGTNEATTVLTVAASAGVAVTAPNTALTWAAGSSQPVTWNVAGSDTAPISTANVRITLSLDGGQTFPIELAASEANDGSATVTVPAGTPSTTTARVKVKGVGNVWFDVSNANFTITGTNSAPTISGTGTVTTRQGSPTASGVVRTVGDAEDGPAALGVSVADVPEGLTVVATNLGGQVSFAATAACELVAPTGGNKTYPVRLDVEDSADAVTSTFVNVLVGRNLPPTLGAYADTAVARSTTTPIAPAAAAADANGNLGGVSVAPTTLPGGGTIAVAADGTVTVATTAGTTFGSYPVRVRVDDGCGAAEIRDFTVTVASTEAVLDIAGSAIATGNGLLEPNECNELNITLANSGTVAATGVSATLSTSTPNVTITQANAAFADIPAGQSRTSTTPFSLSSAGGLVCFSSVDLTLTVTFAGGASPLVDTLQLTAGQPPATNYAFTASSGATIPAGGALIAGSNVDDALVNVVVPAGFSFGLYSDTILGGTTLRASTNGTLQFVAGAGSRQYDNAALPSDGSGNFAGETFPVAAPTLMPFWDDLRLDTAGGGIYTQTLGVAPNRQFVVEWRGMQYANSIGAQNANFAIVFTEGSNGFDYVYAQTAGAASANGASATIGLQAANSGTTFTQFSLNSASVTPGTRLSAALPAAICSAGSGGCGAVPAVVVTQSGGSTGVAEGGPGDSYTLVLATAPSSDVTITLAPGAGVAIAGGNTRTFTPVTWNMAQTIDVSAQDDRTVEGARAATITATAAGGGYDAVAVPAVAVTLADNDSATYQYALASSSSDEGAGTVNIAVGLTFTTSGSGSPALAGAITVPVSIGGASTATGGGVDYTLGSANVVIPTDGTAQNVAVTLVDGAGADADETIVLALGSETGGTAAQQAVVTAGTPASHTLTITDADVAGVLVAETGGDTAVTEGGAGDSYTLVLTSQPTASVTITIAPDAELTATPTTRTFTTGNWNVAQSVAVGAVDDADIEGAHLGTLTHTASGGDYGVVAVPQLAVDVADDDLIADLAVDVVRSAGPVMAGQPVTFQVTVNNLSDLIDVASADFGFVVAPLLENVEWTCAADLGATCPPVGTGVPAHSIALPRDTGVQYTISGDVPAAALDGAVFTATATIAPDAPNSDDNAANDSDAATATVDGNAIFDDGFEGNP